MINGLGVVGWGVGGIEAEAVMLGQPMYMLLPEVVGFELTGELPAGATATDLVLTVTQILRKRKRGRQVRRVLRRRRLARCRSPIGPRSATWPRNTARRWASSPSMTRRSHYLRRTGRTQGRSRSGRALHKEQGLFRTDDAPVPTFTKTLSARPGHGRAQPRRSEAAARSRAAGRTMKAVVRASRLTAPIAERGFAPRRSGHCSARPRSSTTAMSCDIEHGAVVIAAITSCTNTSNPSVMVAAGLLAKKAVEKGLNVPPYVKTSLAPGSRVVTDYFDKAGLTEPLQKLGFYTVGYGCTTCIGNSGPLPEPIAKAVTEGRPGRGGGPHRQSQLRRPHQPAREGQLPGQPAAGRRLRPGRHHRHRPGQRTARHRHGRQGRVSQRHLADARRSAATVVEPSCCRRCSRSSTTTSSKRTRSGTRSTSAKAICTIGTPRARTSKSRRS